MKHSIYIMVFTLFISCANKQPNDERSNFVDVESEAMNFSNTDFKTAIEYSSFSLLESNLAKQKLQELYDLTLLLKQHPEFEKDIALQIANISQTGINLPSTVDNIKIENVRQFGDVITIEDSILKVNLDFDIVSEHSIRKDSIIAIVTTKTFSLDGIKSFATKIKFSNY